MLQDELAVPRRLPQQQLVIPVAVMREHPLQEALVGGSRIDRLLVQQPQHPPPVPLVQVGLRRPDDAVLRGLVQEVHQGRRVDQVLVLVLVAGDFNVLLGVAVAGSHEVRVVEQELETLLEVVVAEVLEGRARLAAASGRILETGGVQEEERSDCVGGRGN